MSSKNFINFHVLISHSPSCLNRDDINMQKTAMFGGVNRVRISSQSLKRAMRTSSYYAKWFGIHSTRTRDIEELIRVYTQELKNKFDTDLIDKTMRLFVESKSDKKKDNGNEDAGYDNGDKKKKLAVAPWSVEEIRALCEIVRDAALTDEEIEKAKSKAMKQKKKTEQEIIDGESTKKCTKAVKGKIQQIRVAIGKTVDIALSGRMATSGLMTSIDGAMAVAHAITTHAVEPQDVDWFTAVDDLTVDAGEPGAGHLDTQQFSSGVFYRYASLNLKQLQVNLGSLSDIKSEETADSRAQALGIARHVFHMLTTVVPSAKQQSFAAHNLADFAVVSFSDQPISLANAFEEPVKRDRGGGFLKPSIAVLTDYWAHTHKAYGLNEKVRAFSVQSGVDLNGSAVESLAEMENWIVADGQG